MVNLISPTVTVGLASAGVGLWLATGVGQTESAIPDVQLASVSSVLERGPTLPDEHDLW